MIIKRSKPCWIAICDNCKADVFGYEYVPHFDSKKELVQMLEDDDIEVDGNKHFCSDECWHEFVDKLTDKQPEAQA